MNGSHVGIIIFEHDYQKGRWNVAACCPEEESCCHEANDGDFSGFRFIAEVLKSFPSYDEAVLWRDENLDAAVDVAHSLGE